MAPTLWSVLCEVLKNSLSSLSGSSLGTPRIEVLPSLDSDAVALICSRFATLESTPQLLSTLKEQLALVAPSSDFSLKSLPNGFVLSTYLSKVQTSTIEEFKSNLKMEISNSLGFEYVELHSSHVDVNSSPLSNITVSYSLISKPSMMFVDVVNDHDLHGEEFVMKSIEMARPTQNSKELIVTVSGLWATNTAEAANQQYGRIARRLTSRGAQWLHIVWDNGKFPFATPPNPEQVFLAGVDFIFRKFVVDAIIAPAMVDFLSALAASGLKISVVGHSLGGRCIWNLLTSSGAPPLHDVFLIAAAVDCPDPHDPVWSEVMTKVVRGSMKIFTNPNDMALKVGFVGTSVLGRGQMFTSEKIVEWDTQLAERISVFDCSDASPKDKIGHSYQAAIEWTDTGEIVVSTAQGASLVDHVEEIPSAVDRVYGGCSSCACVVM
jgi:hypothetical protein